MTRRNRSTQTQTQNNTTTDPKTEPDTNQDTPDTTDTQDAPDAPDATPPKGDAKPEPTQPRIIHKPGHTAKRAAEHKLQAAQDTFAQERENHNGYADAGIFYASKTPVANSFGFELGIVNKDEKTKSVKRTGFGLYFRSDHLCNRRFDIPDVLV